MNMLCDALPEALEIDNITYKIHTDFRVWVKFEMLLINSDSDSDKLLNDIISLIFPILPPADKVNETVEKIMWFYRCGKEQQKASTSKSVKEIFSYDIDDGYICAAFMQQYKINLTTCKMHWWQFRAYMLSLNDNTEFVKIMGYRSVEISSQMTTEQRNFYQKMKKQYAIPKDKKLQQQITEIENALLNGEVIDNLL